MRNQSRKSRHKGIPSDVNGLIKKAETEMGCVVKRTKGGHYTVHYKGCLVATIPANPGDGHSLRNALSQITRNIAKVDEKGNTL